MNNKSRACKNAKIIVLCLIITSCIFGAGCAKEDHSSSFDMVEAMSTALSAAPSLPDMTTVTEADGDKGEAALAAVTDMDKDKFTSYGVSYSSEGKADEIVILNLKNSKDISDAANALNAHVLSRQTLFENYDAKEAKRYDDAKVFTQGSCAVLIVCDDMNAVNDAIVSLIAKADTGEEE